MKISLFAWTCKRLRLFLSPILLASLLGCDSEASLSLLEKAIQNPERLAHLDLSKSQQHPIFIKDFIFWLKIQNVPDVLTFDQIAQFLNRHSDWPHRRRMQLAAENQLGKKESAVAVLSFFQKHPPISAQGHRAYLQALLQTKQIELARGALQETWVKTAFSPRDQQLFLASFRSFLKPIHHEARLEEMLWQQNVEQAKQMMAYVSESKRRQAQVWVAFLENNPSALTQYNTLPVKSRMSEGLNWAFVCWLKKQKKHDQAVQMIMAHTHGISHPLAWWKERNYLAREMLQVRKPEVAYRLVTQHHVPGSFIKEYAEAEWFAGWLALRFLNRPQDAKKHFEQFQRVVKTPISLARAGYWLGRTYEVLNQLEAARKAYTKASLYKTTFYGQLAALKINKTPFPSFADAPQVSASDRKAFEKRDLVQLAKLLKQAGPKADPFLKSILKALAKHAHTSSEKQMVVALTAEVMPTMAAEIDRHALDVSGTVLKAAYPLLPLPSKTAQPQPEVALVMAVIHRETRFDHKAVGDAGERGLMQIMPQTASLEAKTLGVSHHPDKLFEPNYNIKLGMAHLTRHLATFRQSYILGVAAYNAGDTAVSRWVAELGNPHQGKLEVVDWIESIPYAGTRDYVQRVLENLIIYRARLGQTSYTLAHVLRGNSSS